MEGLTTVAASMMQKEENGKGHIRRRRTTTITTTTGTVVKDTPMPTNPKTTIVTVDPPAPSVGKVVEATLPLSAGSLTVPGAGLLPKHSLTVQGDRTTGPAVGPHTKTSS